MSAGTVSVLCKEKQEEILKNDLEHTVKYKTEKEFPKLRQKAKYQVSKTLIHAGFKSRRL